MSNLNYISSLPSTDDKRLQIIRRDITGGQNTRKQATHLEENELALLQNVDIGISGERLKRKGALQVGITFGTKACVSLDNFVVDGEIDQLLVVDGTYLRKWAGSSNFSNVKTDFTDTTYASMTHFKESGLSPDDVMLIQNETDNAFRVDSDGNMQDLGDTNTSPPKTLVNVWFNNRMWGLKDDLLYFSDAYAADYSGAFDRTTNAFRIPVGEERGLIPTRDLGLIIFGQNAVWALSPSLVPDPTTDKPQPIDISRGCVAYKTVAQVGEDIMYLSQDGVRSLRRTIQDKLQGGASFPISYNLKDEYENISWNYIKKATAIYYDNKLFIALPVKSAKYNNRVWVYYPAYGTWTVITGWNVGDFAKYIVNGEERLYYADAVTGKVYQAWTNYTDNGTAIEYIEEGRGEDFGLPLHKKVGGEIEIEVAAAGGDYDITVEAAIDGSEYQELGTINLTSDTAPTLPVDLPFKLSENYMIVEKFHLDNLEAFRTISFRLSNDSANTTEIKVYGHNVVTYLEEYEGEKKL